MIPPTPGLLDNLEILNLKRKLSSKLAAATPGIQPEWQGSGELENQKLKPKGWMKAICCSCWPSVSSCGEGGNLDKTTAIASAEHMTVQD
ncbi:hypothetical protein ACET3Z_030023 [Daucus carota]